MCKCCEENKSIGVSEPLGVCVHYPDILVVRGVDKQGWNIGLNVKIAYCPMCR